MKKLALLLLIALSPITQAIEIATLDMNHVFENYYLTIIENEKLGKQKEIAESTLKHKHTRTRSQGHSARIRGRVDGCVDARSHACVRGRSRRWQR